MFGRAIGSDSPCSNSVSDSDRQLLSIEQSCEEIGTQACSDSLCFDRKNAVHKKPVVGVSMCAGDVMESFWDIFLPSFVRRSVSCTASTSRKTLNRRLNLNESRDECVRGNGRPLGTIKEMRRKFNA